MLRQLRACVRVLADNPRGMLLFVDEMAAWVEGFDCYRNGRGGDRSFWLQVDNGGPYDRPRANEEATQRVPNLSMSIIGLTQPDKMHALAGKGLAEDGFIQRTFAVNLADAPRPVDEAPDTAAADAYTNLVRRLLSANVGVVITLSEEAHTARQEVDQWVDDIKTLTPPWQGALLQHLGKWTGRFARLLLLFHAIECGAQDVPTGRIVSGSTAKRVRDFMINYLLPHQEHFYRTYLGGNRTAGE